MVAPSHDPSPPPPPDEVQAEWTDPHLPTVFARWHPYVAGLQRATIGAVIAAAGVKPGFAVVDVGCGSGIPALALAEIVGPAGRVAATDPSPVFVAAVAANARRLGLANLEAIQASAAGLPFAPAGFDAATCHMGVMFFSDVGAGLARIRAVLRPGARAAFVAWGGDAGNAFFGSFWGAARPHLPPDPPNAAPTTPDPDAPGPMRFAPPGSLGAALRAAGFGEVQEETRTLDLVWPGPAESLRDFWLALTRIEDKVSADRRDGFHADVLASLRRHVDGDAIRFPAPIVVASGMA